MMKKLLCLLIPVIMLILVACDRDHQEKAPQGTANRAAQNRQAPDITVKALNGTEVKLSDYKGKVVMLNFWASWCPPCREEIPSMIKLNKLMAEKPFQMLAVSIDEGGKADVVSFLKSSSFSLPAYTDSDRKAAVAYGVTGVPETFIIDTKGMIVKKVIGPMKWDDAEVVSFLTKLAQ